MYSFITKFFCFPFHSSSNMVNNNKRIKEKKSKTRKMMGRSYYCKKKSVYVDEEQGEDYGVYLKLTVFEAVGIDNSDDHHNNPVAASQTSYQVVFWVDPDDERMTKKVYARPNPVWDQTGSIELDKHIGDYRFLYLEILRYSLPGTIPDPETSCGRKMVGRTRICIPALGRKISGKFDLFRLDNQEPGGYISLRLEAQKVTYI